MKRILLIASLLCLSVPSCKTGQSAWDNVVTDVTTIVDCTRATCAEAGPVCAQITSEVLACLPSIVMGNAAPCAALVNVQNGKLAFADLICIVDAFSQPTPANALAQRYLATANTGAPSLAETQAAARSWIASQGVGVIRAKAAK